MGKKISCDKRLTVANEMPPLHRTQPGKPYSYKNDDVIKWIAARPGLVMYVFDKLCAGGYIAYNSDTGKWQGVYYGD